MNVINYIGVDINKAVRNPYYARMLPFVSGLGPRKAQQLLQDVRNNVSLLLIEILHAEGDSRAALWWFEATWSLAKYFNHTYS